MEVKIGILGFLTIVCISSIVTSKFGKLRILTISSLVWLNTSLLSLKINPPFELSLLSNGAF